MYQKTLDEKSWEAVSAKEVTKHIKSRYPQTVKSVIRELQEDKRIVRLGMYFYRWAA
jgi:hypothetical protein